MAGWGGVKEAPSLPYFLFFFLSLSFFLPLFLPPLKISHYKQYKRICVALLGRNKLGQMLAGLFHPEPRHSSGGEMQAHLAVLSPTPLGWQLLLATPGARTPAAGPVGCVPGLKRLRFVNSPNPRSSMMCSYCCSHAACR